MNNLTVTIRIYLVTLLNLLAVNSYCQDSENISEIQHAIERKQFTFLARSVTPMKGGSRQLNSDYTLRIKGDTLICNLPYFGRVYQPSLNADGGFNFTSSQFDYQIKTRKKGGWDVTIMTKDLPSQRKFYLTVSKDGSTSVRVNCNDRESIGYYGIVTFSNREKQ